MKPYSINKVLPEGRGGFAKAKTVTTTLTAFMASADPEIAEVHVPRFRVLRKKPEPEHFNPSSSHVPVDIKEYINPKEIPVWTPLKTYLHTHTVKSLSSLTVISRDA